MANPSTTAAAIRVLLVDDNEPYRKAFRRNLTLENFDVSEAENADQAMEAIKTNAPDVMVTDLQMRTRSEGLDLIRQARDVAPLMPIIMISGVGTFEEGGKASQLGATHVVAKSQIEEEIERLPQMIRAANDERAQNEALLARIRGLAGGEGGEAATEELRKILAANSSPEWAKSEAFEALAHLAADTMDAESRSAADKKRQETDGREAPSGEDLDRSLTQALPEFEKLDAQSRDSLRTAEYLYQIESRHPAKIDFSRNIGFSYCFAVENESKAVLGRKIQRMLLNPQAYDIVNNLLEGQARRLGVFFHQLLLQIQRDFPMDFTADNVRQVFERILEHRDKYKPDGLKALAVVALVFGRNYKVRTARASIEVKNPLGIKGLETDAEIFELAQRLARLQHYRNPYIHPEISEMEKLSAIRQETISSLGMLRRIF